MPTNDGRTVTRAQARASAMSRSKSPPPPVAKKVIFYSKLTLFPEGMSKALFNILNYVPLSFSPLLNLATDDPSHLIAG